MTVETAPVKAFEVKGDELGYHNQANAAGAFCFLVNAENERVGIMHACPCGCRNLTALHFRGKSIHRPEWDVVGEWPNVTLSPSIGTRHHNEPNGFHWHGYLERGWFVNERREAPA